ncbi:hypothetical protein JVY00_16200 [Tsukamurella tyrosinosolvens]|uniref:hypothetical protein n=1 Tax=Tsukamurella tyrosinosolvens TaxID=57704 RepID=UPI001AF7BCA8|nr:hypothetical protein [Tsukamurella tyrosinosolvens]QRY83405.1 hypothetical protein JVY00_16200 [Tsukamurella tyrosinosolvens]
MPITVIAPRGELTAEGERDILPRLTVALLAASGATGNAFLSKIIGGTVHVLPTENVYAGGAHSRLVMVELKLPDIGLADVAARADFIARATEIVADLTVEDHSSDDTWVNIMNALDGGWGIGGRQFRSADLIAAITAAAD